LSDLDLDPGLTLTLKLKQNYLTDPKGAKSDILSQPDCPNFPQALWINIILNQYIDLDKIFAGYYSLEPNHCQTQTIGDVELVFNSRSNSKNATKKLTLMVNGQSPLPPSKRLYIHISTPSH